MVIQTPHQSHAAFKKLPRESNPKQFRRCQKGHLMSSMQHKAWEARIWDQYCTGMHYQFNGITFTGYFAELCVGCCGRINRELLTKWKSSCNPLEQHKGHDMTFIFFANYWKMPPECRPIPCTGILWKPQRTCSTQLPWLCHDRQDCKQ